MPVHPTAAALLKLSTSLRDRQCSNSSSRDVIWSYSVATPPRQRHFVQYNIACCQNSVLTAVCSVSYALQPKASPS